MISPANFNFQFPERADDLKNDSVPIFYFPKQTVYNKFCSEVHSSQEIRGVFSLQHCRGRYNLVCIFMSIGVSLNIKISQFIVLPRYTRKGYQPEARGYVSYSPRVLPEGAARGQHTRGMNHITTSWRPINGLFLHWRGFLKGCKNTLKKNSSIVHLSFVFQHSMLALVGFTSFSAF